MEYLHLTLFHSHGVMANDTHFDFECHLMTLIFTVLNTSCNLELWAKHEHRHYAEDKFK